MKKFRILLGVSLIVSSLLTGVAVAGNSPKPPSYSNQVVTAKKFTPNKFTHVLKTEKKNLYGSVLKEKIVFYVQESKNGMPLYWSLVVNGYEKVRLSNEGGFYSQAEFKLQDIGQDNMPEILIYRYCTGSSGATGLNIYRPANLGFKEIFAINNNLDSSRFTVKYIGSYKVSFADKLYGFGTIVTFQKSRYTGIEKSLKNISNWVDPIADYKLVDIDGDKIKEIIAIQRVIGIAHADTIANYQTTYKLINGKYQAVTLALFTDQNKIIAELKTNIKTGNPTHINQGIATNKQKYEVVSYDALPQILKDKIAKQEVQASTKVVKEGDNQYIYIGLGERSSGGYRVNIESCEDVEGRISVVYSEFKPKGITIAVLTYPYIVIKVALPLPVTITSK